VIYPTAVIVLGLLEFGEATPYDLKVRVAGSIGNFWSVPHSALYAEPERLAKAGLVEERREEGGRRRRVFSITAAGRRALRGDPRARADKTIAFYGGEAPN
jgi:PadR family transcriptional regulator AphA